MSLSKHSTKIEVQAATMAELVEFYNAETGKSIKKFETRAKGVERCLGLLAKEPAAPSAMAKIALNLTASGPILKVVKSAAKPTPTKPVAQARTPAFSADAVITVVHKGENPKRGTAAARYELYRSGMTVAAYIAAGGQRRDVVWDRKMGWITVKG